MATLIMRPASLIVPGRIVRSPARPVLDAMHPLSRGLVGAWPLGDVVAALALTRDISLSGNNGTLNGGITFGDSDRGGRSLTLNGTTGYVSAPSLAVYNQNDFTLWCHVNLVSLTGGGGGAEPALMTRAPTTNTAGEYFMYIDKTSHKLTVDVPFVVGACVTGTTVFTTSKWYVCSISRRGNVFKAYVNGKLETTTTTVAAPTYAGLFYIGTFQNGPGPSYLNGKIGNARVYSRALSDSEQAWLFAEPYAGVYEAAQSRRVGVAAAGGARPVKMAGRWNGFAGRSGGFAG